MQYSVKWTQFNPTKCFCKQEPNENWVIVENKFNPIPSTYHVHLGTKLKVLIEFFKEKSNSLHQFIILNVSLEETK